MTAQRNKREALIALGLALGLGVGLTACTGQKSEELNAYYQYSSCRGPECFQRLSPAQKQATFFGAMRVHPPDISIEQDLSKEDIDFLEGLQAEIERRGGSYEAYSFVAAINKKAKRGEITDKQLHHFDLVSFCRERGDINNLCSSITL